MCLDIGGFDRLRQLSGSLVKIAVAYSTNLAILIQSLVAAIEDRWLYLKEFDDARSGYKTTTGTPINIYYIAKLKLCIGCLRYR